MRTSIRARLTIGSWLASGAVCDIGPVGPFRPAARFTAGRFFPSSARWPAKAAPTSLKPTGVGGLNPWVAWGRPTARGAMRGEFFWAGEFFGLEQTGEGGEGIMSWMLVVMALGTTPIQTGLVYDT